MRIDERTKDPSPPSGRGTTVEGKEDELEQRECDLRYNKQVSNMIWLAYHRKWAAAIKAKALRA